ncbi:hypothetical protein [Streptomyces goshikiensis]|uniref:hypothetical protein n=1 Tax=Streptomyces goshikiensis TaxID=1942 RepID=UPI00365A653B
MTSATVTFKGTGAGLTTRLELIVLLGRVGIRPAALARVRRASCRALSSASRARSGSG